MITILQESENNIDIITDKTDIIVITQVINNTPQYIQLERENLLELISMLAREIPTLKIK